MIRWRQPRDDKGIVELVRTQLIPISHWQHPRGERLHFEITRRIRKGATLVAAQSAKNSPIGFLHMEFNFRALFIDLLAVNSRYQKKQLGTALMLRAEQYAIKKGYVESHVFVDDDNVRAIRFYQKLGYYPLRVLKAFRVIELAKPLS